MKRQDISNIEVCKAYARYAKERKEWPYEILAKKFECEEKLAYAACKRASDKGLIEYGVSLRSGWLSEKGWDLLEQS